MGRQRKPRPLASTPPTPFWRSAFALSLAGGGLLWGAFAPLGCFWLAWLAPVFWLLLVRSNALPGSRPYLGIWLAGAAFWLAMLQGIRLAHPLLYLGWFALSFYLAAYLPGFVWLTRIAVHRWRIPLILAAPVVWTGLELLRGRFLTGFAVGLLAHTQIDWPQLIQISDLCGAYGVSFMMMLVAACLARMLPGAGQPRVVFWPVLPLAIVLAGTLGYGHVRMAATSVDQASDGGTGPAAAPLRVALIQRVVDTKFVADPERNLDTFDQYWQATLGARQENPDLDLIIWPESVFTENHPEVLRDANFGLPDDIPFGREEFLDRFEQRREIFRDKVRNAATRTNRLWRGGAFEQLDTYLLVGTETVDFGPDRVRMYNSALLINPAGEIVDRYYKMHPVMFGEYIPFGNWIPLIYQLSPMGQGITPGDAPEAFQVAGKTLAPSICFESSVPHLIRRQVVELSRQGAPPDILVNVTHDGWFFGSSILELQFAGTVFRAVELRRPVLVAANAGISCWIDGSGVVQARGPRRGNDVVFANVLADGRWSGYLLWGDLPAAICLAACLLLVAVEMRARGSVGGVLGGVGKYWSRNRPQPAAVGE